MLNHAVLLHVPRNEEPELDANFEDRLSLDLGERVHVSDGDSHLLGEEVGVRGVILIDPREVVGEEVGEELSEGSAEDFEGIQLGDLLFLNDLPLIFEVGLVLGKDLLDLVQNSNQGVKHHVLVVLEVPGVQVVLGKGNSEEGHQAVHCTMHVVFLIQVEYDRVADQVALQDEGNRQIFEEFLEGLEAGFNERGIQLLLLEVGVQDEATDLVDRLELVGEFLLELLDLFGSEGLVPKLEDFLGEFRENGEHVLAVALGLVANGGEVGEGSGPAVLEFLFDDFDEDGVGLAEIDATKTVSVLHETGHVVFEVVPDDVLLLLVEKPPLFLDSLLDALQCEKDEVLVGGLLDDVCGLNPKVGLFIELFQHLSGILHFLLVPRIEVVNQLF